MRKHWRMAALGAFGAASLALAGVGEAQAQGEQFVPRLVYRTGAYAPNGVPFANGYADYLTLLNERDGGVNGVRLQVEECETGYDTARGVECYDRLKGKGSAVVDPLSTGITFALTEKAPGDKIPLITMGYGRSESQDGSVFGWNFPLLGTYWSAADIMINYIAQKEGGYPKLKGKKITLVFHDSPFGKEPIPVLEELAKKHGFVYAGLPVAAPGVEQKATWLQVRQSRPDWVLLWGWGVMNSTSIKEAAAVNYPRNKMIGVWWSGAEPDVVPGGDGAKGYMALNLHAVGDQFPVHRDVYKNVYDKNKGAAKRDEVGQVLYNRGLVNGFLAVEAMRTAMAKFGNKPVNGEQMRWGIEHLDLTAARIKEAGFEGLVYPLKLSCTDHMGSARARVQQWDGAKWNFVSDWIEADRKVLDPMVAVAAKKYAEEKKIAPRDCSKEM